MVDEGEEGFVTMFLNLLAFNFVSDATNSGVVVFGVGAEDVVKWGAGFVLTAKRGEGKSGG